MATLLLHKDLEGFLCFLCHKEVKKGEFLNHQFYCGECSLGVEIEEFKELPPKVISETPTVLPEVNPLTLPGCIIVENQVVS